MPGFAVFTPCAILNISKRMICRRQGNKNEGYQSNPEKENMFRCGHKFMGPGNELGFCQFRVMLLSLLNAYVTKQTDKI